MIVIPEHIAVIIKKAIFWSVTGSVDGSIGLVVVFAASSMMVIVLGLPNSWESSKGLRT